MMRVSWPGRHETLSSDVSIPNFGHSAHPSAEQQRDPTRPDRTSPSRNALTSKTDTSGVGVEAAKTVAKQHIAFAGTVALELWLVRNQLGGDGLRVEAWAATRQAVLHAQTAVQCADVLANDEGDEVALEGTHIAGLVVRLFSRPVTRFKRRRGSSNQS